MDSKRVSGRIAANKVKEAELAEKQPILFKVRKNFGPRGQTKLWSASEKEKLLDALRIYGTTNISRLKREVPYRSEAAVKSFVEREKVKMTQVYREVILPDGRMKVRIHPYF